MTRKPPKAGEGAPTTGSRGCCGLREAADPATPRVLGPSKGQWAVSEEADQRPKLSQWLEACSRDSTLEDGRWRVSAAQHRAQRESALVHREATGDRHPGDGGCWLTRAPACLTPTECKGLRRRKLEVSAVSDRRLSSEPGDRQRHLQWHRKSTQQRRTEKLDNTRINTC